MNVLKYTYMIIPFRFSETLKFDNDKCFTPVDHSVVKYDRLYKHVGSCISPNNALRTIFDYNVNIENLFPHFYNQRLDFGVEKAGNTYKAEGKFNEALVFTFSTGVGFIVLNLVFDENTDIEDFCEIMNNLKKINRSLTEAKFEISCNDEKVNLFEILTKIQENINGTTDLFFQHNSDKYVSATMLNSFTFTEKTDEGRIFHYLESLRKSQGDTFGTLEEIKGELLHPFKNMYWGFSTQGVANINCVEPDDDNYNFYKFVFHKNVRQEYLLMTLILLNQEFTLLDLCAKFTLKDEELKVSDLNRLYEFKLVNTFSVVSHLENYREFYKKYYDTLNIGEILNEVENKQNSVYQTYKNKQNEKIELRNKKINIFTKVLTVVLSIFGILGIIESLWNLWGQDGVVDFAVVVFCVICATVGIVLGIIQLVEFATNKKGNKDDDERL